MDIAPLKKGICKTISIPGSKSYTNRALIMAALTQGAVSLKNPLYSDDTLAMMGCLRSLGIEIETYADELIVHGDVSSIQEKEYRLFAHDSGTTIRFLLALLCIVPGIKTIQGSERLNERPIRDLVDGLRELGARIEYCGKEGALPLKVLSSSLSGDAVHLKGDVSSQFCSALLLIAPYLPRGLTIHIQGTLISKPYVEMTLSCMKEWGVYQNNLKNRFLSAPHPFRRGVVGDPGVALPQNFDSHSRLAIRQWSLAPSYFVPKGQSYRMKEYQIEGDFSSAAYFFAIGALTQSTITVENLNPLSAQPDRKFLEILARMNHRIINEQNRIRIEGKEMLPLDVEMEDCPDQVMTLAVLASFAKGVTRISGIRSLRVKESERVLAVRNELAKMGIRTEETPDTLTIYGGSPQGAEIKTYQDHRIAMSFAVAGTVLPGMAITSPEVVNKTFPTFWTLFRSLE